MSQLAVTLVQLPQRPEHVSGGIEAAEASDGGKSFRPKFGNTQVDI